MLPAGRITRLLDVQSEIDLVGQHLHVSLRLHSAAHHAECFPGLSIFKHKTGYYRVKRALPRRVYIRVSRLHRKKFVAILKHESKSRHDNAAAHSTDRKSTRLNSS